MLKLDVAFQREKKVDVYQKEDVEEVLEHNKQLRTMEQDGDLRHIASIPNIILTLWLNQEWESGNHALRPFTKEFDAIIARKLKDPDWAYLRTDAPRHWLGYGNSR